MATLGGPRYTPRTRRSDFSLSRLSLRAGRRERAGDADHRDGSAGLRIHQNGAVVREVKVTLPTDCKGPRGAIDAGATPFSVDEGSGFEVELVATGPDAVRLRDVTVAFRQVDQSSGVEGGRGYCLSTDTTDTFGDDHQKEACAAAKSFDFAVPPVRPLTLRVATSCQKVGLKNTETANPLTVSVSWTGPHDVPVTMPLSLTTCTGNVALQPATLGADGRGAPTTTARVTFMTSGDDAAWLDYVSLSYGRPTQVVPMVAPLGPDGSTGCQSSAAKVDFPVPPAGTASWSCRPSITVPVPMPPLR
jgi:hypothetical protein